MLPRFTRSHLTACSTHLYWLVCSLACSVAPPAWDRGSAVFTTTHHDQDAVVIKVLAFYGGEPFEMGAFELGGIAPQPTGVPQVTFESIRGDLGSTFVLLDWDTGLHHHICNVQGAGFPVGARWRHSTQQPRARVAADYHN